MRVGSVAAGAGGYCAPAAPVGRPRAVPQLHCYVALHGGVLMTVDRTITVRRLRTGSVFRLLAAGIFFSTVPFFILMGGFAGLGFNTLRWNNEPVLGIKGLLLSPLMGLIAAAIFTALAGAGVSFGLWLYSKFRPLTLRMLEDTDAPAT